LQGVRASGRHAPGTGRSVSAGGDDRALRDALGRFATGVTVITTRGPGGEPVGMTANSFAAVSLEPPLVLWSIARQSPSYDAFEEAPHFAVNVLRAGDRDLSNHFATPAEDKFDGVGFVDGIGGAPLLGDPLASFECRTWQRYDGGDHLIIVGLVERFVCAEGRPLLFYSGGYATARDMPHPELPDEASAPFSDLLL